MKYFLDANIIIDILNGNRKTLLNISSHTDDIIRIPDISYDQQYGASFTAERHTA